jgi:serine phosphatase RsbU (regulator of sigma subunit)/anti-sigma regulatory factor (Ser/Thr protein kinase)
MPDSSLNASRGVTSRIVFRCGLAEAREATKSLREFLSQHGLAEQELFACELCLAEACNNAVEYADERARDLPVVAEAICTRTEIELRVTDHTAGFEWPGKVATPAPDCEHGRGLFIMQSLMDDVRYARGQHENILIMRKGRTPPPGTEPAGDPQPDALEKARQRIVEYERTLTGMAREHCFRSESLSAIFRCCAELGRTNDFEGFAQRLLSDLLHLAAAEWYVLRLIPPRDQRLFAFATSSPELQSGPIHVSTASRATPSIEAEAARTRHEVRFDAAATSTKTEPLRAAGPAPHGLVLPLMFGQMLVGTLAVGRRTSDSEFSELQIEMIRTFSEFLAIQIVNTRHQEAEVHARLVAHELDIARNIQRALNPRSLPQLEGFGLAGSCESAREVGGDFCDALSLDDHSMLLVVADVMGKGVPAAIFATITRSLVRAMAPDCHQPAELLARLNRHLYEELSAVSMFITVQLVFIDLQRRELVAASAGHCPVMVVSPETGIVETVRTTGIPLGILPDVTYAQQTATLDDPGCLLLYTDGLTEARNLAGDMFGQERLAEWLREHCRRGHRADQLRDELASDLIAFRGGAPLHDDQAFLILAEDHVPAHTRSVAPPPAKKSSRAEEGFRISIRFWSPPTLPIPTFAFA